MAINLFVNLSGEDYQKLENIRIFKKMSYSELISFLIDR